MDHSRRRQIEAIFHKVIELPEGERDAAIQGECCKDESLCGDVRQLFGVSQEELQHFMQPLATVPVRIGEAVEHDTPAQIRDYKILDTLGEGGFGVVYLAEQLRPVKRRVALKVIKPGMNSKAVIARFEAERQALAMMNHPNVARIFDAGTTEEGRPYFVMELVSGAAITEHCDRHKLTIEERLELFIDVCDAVQHAHQKGIIHRDIKPGNILVEYRDGESICKVIDFGVAKAIEQRLTEQTIFTQQGQLIGTPAYMSPEQAEMTAEDLDTRCDIYSLGVVLFELLSGRLPFDLKRKAIPEAVRIIREDEPTRLSSIETVFRGDIETIVGKALARDRRQRYQSAAELAADIRRHLANEPITARPPTAIYQISKFARRHRGLVAGLALALFILVVGTITSVTLAFRASRGMQLATEKEVEAQRTSDRLSVKVAQADSDTAPLSARLHLDDVSPEARGWEWHHIRARLDAHVAEYTTDPNGLWRRPRGRNWRATTTICRPDGVLVSVFARQGGLEVVNLTSGLVEQTIAYASELSWPDFSPDGRRVSALSAAEDKLIVWDLATGDRILDLPIEVAAPTDVCFSPDGRHLAIASVKSVGSEVIDLDTGRSARCILSGGTNAFCIAFSPVGDRLVIVESGGGTSGLSVFSLSGERLASHVLPADLYHSIIFSPDGRLLAIGQKQRTIRVFDAATFEELHVLFGHTGAVTALAFMPDGQRLASGAMDGTVRLWNLEDGSTERVITGLPPDCPPSSLAFTPDGAMLAAGGVSGTRIWALERGARRTIEAHDYFVYNAAFSPDGHTIVSAPFTGNVRLWNSLDGRQLAEFPSAKPLDKPAFFLAFASDGARLLINIHSADEKIPLMSAWDPAAGVRLTAPRRASDSGFFRPRGEDLRDGRLTGLVAVPGGTRSAHVALSADRRLIAFATGAGNPAHLDGLEILILSPPTREILVLDTATRETVSGFGKRTDTVRSVAFSPDGRRVVSGDVNGTVTVWDLLTETVLASMTAHTSEVFSVVYSPDGSRIVSGGNDGSIILWDAESFENVLTLRAHQSYVYSVVFSKDGTMMASASGDGTVRIWDSVPPAERWRQTQRASALRPAAELVVDRLMSRLTDALDVADEIRGDTTLDDDLRRVALSVLLQRSPFAVPPLP